MEKETTEEKRNEMKETGSMKLDSNNRKHNVRLLTIIGEIEGHEAVSGNTKATKYERDRHGHYGGRRNRPRQWSGKVHGR